MQELTNEELDQYKFILKNYKPQIQNGYCYYSVKKKKYKRSRMIMELELRRRLLFYEIVHHKDHNKLNDDISNLEVLNSELHNSMHHAGLKHKKPIGWKPANTIKPFVINRAREISKEMVKVNYEELSRRLKKEGLIITGYTLKKYLRD